MAALLQFTYLKFNHWKCNSMQYKGYWKWLKIGSFFYALPLHEPKPPALIHEVQINVSLHKLYLCKVELSFLVFICSVLHLIRIWQFKPLFHSLVRDLSFHPLTFNCCYSWSINTPESPSIFKSYHILNTKKKEVYKSWKLVNRKI